MNKKILTSVASIIVVCLLGYLIYKMYSGDSRTNPISVASSTPTTFSISGWQTCDYPSFGIRFQYPPDWNVYVYSLHEGAGNLPVKENCGDIDAGELDPEITLAPSPDWSSGMQITASRTQSQFLASSTTSLGGYPSYVDVDGSIFVNGYKLAFGKNVTTSTRDSVLSNFQFTSQ